ncbi:double-stranded RNA-binding protein 1 [Amaranthus tricolor]|uniref:double-stranded RNA-binding protein 1 n=1 Tax=Amaranthus tricolor TaxID=29722 RepID=UPI00258F05EE|nr:double-stranded RNA-binding protein 1 [Amaranthus tricolor]
MFKSRLQELCQSKKWKLPEYILTREGLDHCPQFQATVVVNGCTYSTPTSSKSSKDAHNLAAEIAFHHLNGSSGFAASQVLPTSVDGNQPKFNQTLQVSSLSGANSPNAQNRDDEKLKGMGHLYKHQLQIYAQKRKLDLPVYISGREGPHNLRFKSKVTLEGKTYESPECYSTIKDAENAASKVALMSLTSNITEEEDLVSCKNLLQEFVQKEHSCLPTYATVRSGPPHHPTFVSTVEINKEVFTGQEAKTRKLAEMYAAKVAYSALKDRKLKKILQFDSPGYIINDTPFCSSPKLHLDSVTELPEKSISSPNPISDRVYMERARFNEVAEPEVCFNLVQNIQQRKVDTSPFQLNSSHLPTPAALVQCSLGPKAHHIIQPSPNPEASTSRTKIKVMPFTPNMTLPAEATVMFQDDKWVALSESM